MDNKEKILESINRLEKRLPSKWDVALIMQIKRFLFPLIRKELEDNNCIYDKAKKIFTDAKTQTQKNKEE